MKKTAKKGPDQNGSLSKGCITKGIFRSLKKVDILFFVFFAVTTALLTLTPEQPPNLHNLLYVRAIILIAVGGLIYLNILFRKPPFLNMLRNIYPILLSGYFYSETVYYNKSFLTNIDPQLENLEHYLFGMQPSLRFSEYFSNPLFSELMYFGYFSFYLLILGFTGYVFLKQKEFFPKAVFLLSSSLYIFYFMFGLIPSEGPQFYFSSPDNILPNAFFFDEVMHFIQQTAEQPTGAFPSSHVGISLIILIMSRKKVPFFFKIALPLTILLILSTVYIKAHYVVDVFGAVLVAPFILYLSNIFYKLSSKACIKE